jgi:hypothetical protein
MRREEEERAESVSMVELWVKEEKLGRVLLGTLGRVIFGRLFGNVRSPAMPRVPHCRTTGIPG